MKAIIISVNKNNQKEFDYYVDECKNLAKANNIEVVDVMIQNLDRVDSKFYIGSGKLEELKTYANEDIDLVIVNDDINGSVNRNLEKALEKRVIDRTQLILEIFSSRAKSKEAKLQVAIARAKYQKTRIAGSYTGMDRQVSGAGVISRGSGETKIETDKRKLSKQISDSEKELEKFVRTREMQRQKRVQNYIPIVSICGYTNAGKSTLMNYLVHDEKQVYEEDMLFATLDTSVRKVELASKMKFLLVDTVGFVSNLPHELVKSFRSTLEEIEQSDLIINLCDISNKNHFIHQKVVEDTIKSLDVENIEKWVVYNKVDKIDNYEALEIGISAKTGKNVDVLLNSIENFLFSYYKEVTLKVATNMNYLISELSEYTYVENIVFESDCLKFKTRLSPNDYEKLKKFVIVED